MMVMASEATTDTNTQSGVSDEVVYSMETDYYDEDICVFVSCVNATMTGHLYLHIHMMKELQQIFIVHQNQDFIMCM